MIGSPAYLPSFNSRYDHRIAQFWHQGQFYDEVRIYQCRVWVFESPRHRFQLATDQYNVFLKTCSMKLHAFGGLYYSQFNINHEVQNLITLFLFVVFRGIAAFLSIYFSIHTIQQMREDQKILYNSYCGTVFFKWDRNQFHKVEKILNLRTNQMSNSTTKNYFAEYPNPYSCKAMFYQNGRVNLSGAKSYEALEQTLADCIICVLMQKLPQMDISILEELSVTNCSAKFDLDYKIDIKRLQCQISKEYGQQSRSNYVYLPNQVYQIQKISVMIAATHCKVTKAHLLPDIQVFVKYINYLLADYKKQDNSYGEEMDIQDQWNKIKKEIKQKVNCIPEVKAEQPYQRIYFDEDD